MLSMLVIGDPHFKNNNVKDTTDMIDELNHILQNNKFDMIVCLGDILDRHEKIDMFPLIRAIDFLKGLSYKGELYVIVGNHDRPNNSDFLTNNHPFTALKGLKNINIIDKVEVFEKNGFKICGVPYVSPGRFKEAVESNKEAKDIDLYLAHQEFKGCQMGAIVSEIGDEWPTTHVISGHIHDYQRLGEFIYYTGTPLMHTYGDKPDKSVSHFTLFKDENQKTCIKEDRIFLNIKKKKLIHLDYKDISALDMDELLRGSDPSLVKIIVSGTSSETKAAQQHKIVKDMEKNNIKICFRQLSEQKEKIDRGNFLHTTYKELKTEKSKELFSKLFGNVQN